ncbi:helix-turn-helix domain-containing protein [Candidatus Glomeribacter gigasporarum]|uniref:helix-turn-helix domain-containing protein n=1 Tax=Candidatus Glomeribacter gigasporarum TaxID=132144 RepID=UPI0002EA18C2|nr:helix-turn-helix transcriptional regulator [Candidatus Glomeribacter gigasporarum]
MPTTTLTDVIEEECQDAEFKQHFQRELLINEIAKLILQLRQRATLTQKELAYKAKTTQPVIARLEKGSDSRVPSLELLTRIATAANAKLKLVIESPCHS